jgi:hypothetical protein
MNGRLLVLALALVTGACMVDKSHVESTPAAARLERGEPIGGSEQRYAVVGSRRDALEIRARARDLCHRDLVVAIERVRIDEKRASPDRFWGAGAAALGAAVLVAKGDSDEANSFAGVLLTGAAALVLAPVMQETTTRTKLPRGETRQAHVPAPCADRPLPNVTVTVRTHGVTLEGTTDAAGRVRFFDFAPERDLLIYVDDVAVPVSFEAAR